MLNSKRIFADAIRQYCRTNGIRCTAKSHDWIFILERDGAARFVVGYDLGLNTSTTHRIINDKSATYEVLSHFGVAAVPHHVFLHPEMSGYVSKSGNWRDMARVFEDLGGDVVVKANEGTGGREVVRARSIPELERAVQSLFVEHRSISVSPFLEIEREIRIFLCRNEATLAYEKHLPTVTGDGEQALSMLIEKDVRRGRLAVSALGPAASGLAPGHVLKRGETVALAWKHNLGQGARATVHDDLSVIAKETVLAVEAAKAVGLTFGTVDIVVADGAPQILEINSGVMMENLVAQHTDGMALAHRIYSQGLDLLFDQPRPAG